jgi:hypothetical protein
MTPLVTVAIPTRNRQVYTATLARSALELLLSCQVVINDNSDDSLRNILGDSIGDPRVAYHYQPGMLSVIENFNATLACSKGEYVTILGDDDMIGPYSRNSSYRPNPKELMLSCIEALAAWCTTSDPVFARLAGGIWTASSTHLAARTNASRLSI